MPATVDSIVCFLEFMAKSCGHPHLKHLLTSVKFLHLALDLEFPEDNFQTDMTMQGLKRKLAHVPFQVQPITPTILRKMYRFVDISKKSDLALWCAFLVCFYGLLRKSNAVPKSSKYDPTKVLVRRNLIVDPVKKLVLMYVG